MLGKRIHEGRCPRSLNPELQTKALLHSLVLLCKDGFGNGLSHLLSTFLAWLHPGNVVRGVLPVQDFVEWQRHDRHVGDGKLRDTPGIHLSHHGLQLVRIRVVAESLQGAISPAPPWGFIQVVQHTHDDLLGLCLGCQLLDDPSQAHPEHVDEVPKTRSEERTASDQACGCQIEQPGHMYYQPTCGPQGHVIAAHVNHKNILLAEIVPNEFILIQEPTHLSLHDAGFLHGAVDARCFRLRLRSAALVVDPVAHVLEHDGWI
mmetsp:Transcript_26730/g.56092  ORF Transcript_26730/g.56092 Transcript_26730/m.56092 type:complete len:261 (-) Transcript_26730:273-1055(-)